MTPKVIPKACPADLDRAFRPEDYGFPPPLTQRQGAARRRAELAMSKEYPGQYVAYLDTWAGDNLEREIVASASETVEFHALLRQLEPEVRRRLEVTLVPDPEDGIEIPSISLEDSPVAGG